MNKRNPVIERAMFKLNKDLDPLGIRLHGVAYNCVWHAIEHALNDSELALAVDAIADVRAAIITAAPHLEYAVPKVEEIIGVLEARNP